MLRLFPGDNTQHPTMDGPNENEVLCNLVGFFYAVFTSTLFTLYCMCFFEAVTPMVSFAMKFI